MRKLLIFVALASAGLSSAFADDFAGLSYQAELSAADMAAIDGQMLTIVVPFNSSGTATVTNSERYGSKTFTVPVTTVAKAVNPNNRPMNAGKEYSVVPLPKGQYSLGNTQKMSATQFGTGIAIKASVTTSYKDSNKTFQANDFYIHQTPYSNTWGCVGVAGKDSAATSANMAKVLNAYNNSSGSKVIIVK